MADQASAEPPAPCPQCGQACPAFDDVQCLLVCEACGCVLSSDESHSMISWVDGRPTSQAVYDPPEEVQGVSSETVVSIGAALIS